MASNIKHVEQERAQWAYETVSNLMRNGNAKELKELKSHLRKLPSHIQTSGLAQSLLFYGQKQEALARRLVVHLGLGSDDVAKAVSTLVQSADRVRLKTRDALAAAQWLKRFGEVLIKGND